jgi:hypothetical protein
LATLLHIFATYTASSRRGRNPGAYPATKATQIPKSLPQYFQYIISEQTLVSGLRSSHLDLKVMINSLYSMSEVQQPEGERCESVYSNANRSRVIKRNISPLRVTDVTADDFECSSHEPKSSWKHNNILTSHASIFYFL